MAKAGVGWVITARNDQLREYWSSNALQRTIYQRKTQRLPPMEMHYETPQTSTNKNWTDQSLLSYRNVDDYLAGSNAFQQASFANIMDKWKEHEKHKTTELIASLDTHYNMKLRFRHDKQLNRASEMKYAPIASYYRYLGNENNPKNIQPCRRYKRQTQDYEERHVRELLKLPTIGNSRSESFALGKRTKLSSMDSSPLIKSSEFGDQSFSSSRHTFS